MARSGILLGINIDHVATLRQARGTDYPDPVAAGLIAEEAGADSITVHLREDRRHIQERDVTELATRLRIRLNLEMAVTEEMLRIAREIRPPDCCLVPERREELTTEGGLDVCGDRARIAEACAVLAESGIRVSLFIDPAVEQVDAVIEAGAPAVELHTGTFADAADARTRASELERIRVAAMHGREAGLHVHAGHGLHYENVRSIATIPEIEELNIGHSVVSRSVFDGMANAVAEMRRLLDEVRPR